MTRDLDERGTRIDGTPVENRSHGFTLLEVMVALGVFAVVTLGVVPLLGSALRAASTARSQTVAEEGARNIMERIQGTGWYVSYDAKPNKRVDLLDLYYPQASSNASMGQSYAANASNAPLVGTGGVFTTTCAPPPAVTNPACAFDVPAGYTVTITASFVKKHTPATIPETYDLVTPGASYAWNSQGNDAPPSSLMDLNVTVGWSQHGKSRSYSLRAILGERKFAAPAAVDTGPSPSASPPAQQNGSARVSGRASVDYVTQVTTGYSVGTAQPANGCPVAPCLSQGVMTFGISESRINSEDVGATADQYDQVADFRIARAYPTSQAPPPTPPPDLASVDKSVSVKHAPPYSLTGTDALDPSISYLTHPELASARQAMIYGGQNANVKVDVANELPSAQGYFQTYGTTSGVMEGYFTNSQIDYTAMHLDSTQPLDYFIRITGGPLTQLGSYTTATTYPLTSSSRAVETIARAGFAGLEGPRIVASSKAKWNMFLMYGLDMQTNCKATADPSTASATATWTTTFSYYYDPTNDGRAPNSPSVGTLTLASSGNDIFNGTAVANALDALQAVNPLEFDGGSTATDLYMFEERDANGNVTKKGFLSDALELKQPPTSVSADGRTATASIDGAIRLDYASLNPAIPETQTNVAIGKLSCEAVDNR